MELHRLFPQLTYHSRRVSARFFSTGTLVAQNNWKGDDNGKKQG
jgi:hypothetical protein